MLAGYCARNAVVRAPGVVCVWIKYSNSARLPRRSRVVSVLEAQKREYSEVHTTEGLR